MLTFTGTMLKNLFRKPATTGYPFEPVTYPERMRGHVELTTESCIACGLCMRSCPPGAIKVERAIGKWTINRFDCIQCGNCANVCPKKCVHIVPGYTEPGTEKIADVFDIPIKPPKKKPAAAAKKPGEAKQGNAAAKKPEEAKQEKEAAKKPEEVKQAPKES